MPALSVGDVLQATGGRLAIGDPAATVTSYSIDTRRLERGGAFFALVGTRTDGHAFISDAAHAGAALAVVSRLPEGTGPFPPAVIHVDDGAAALARCGALARQRLTAKVVALTGSAGKTTTKEFIAAGLSASFRTHRTTGNLNNELGVPLTLLACPEDAEMAVIEMGMNGPGQIAFLARLADPHVGLVTNVRPVHLEFFSSLDEIAAAKGELFAVLRADATAVVNLDDARVRIQAARHGGARVTFGRSEQADLRAEMIADRFVPGAGLTFSYEGRSYAVPLKVGGAHAALDALAAAAAVVALGAPLEPALAAMSAMEPASGRGRITHLPGDISVVDDTYNSNPEALASVLGTLAASEPSGRRVLVMGDMLELGERSAELHRELGREAARAGVDSILLVGTQVTAAAAGAREAGLGTESLVHFGSAEEAALGATELVRSGDVVLVKGSRGMALECVVSALKQHFGTAAMVATT